MKNNLVELRGTHLEREIAFPSVFNVAVPFIDRHIAEGRGEKLAIRAFAGDVTYTMLHEGINRYGNALRDLGLQKGERVVMVVEDCAEFFYLFWGAIKAGIIPIPISTMLRPVDFAYIIDDSGCTGFFYSSQFTTNAQAALDLSERPPIYAMQVDGDDGTLATAAQAADSYLDAALTTAEDDCFWLYSSGTTGRPKGAVHAHRNMVYTSQCYAVDTLGAEESDIFYSIPRLFFAYGLGCAMTFPLWVGGTAILDPRRPTPETNAEVLNTFRPTVYAAVPTFYAAFLYSLETCKPDLSSLRRCVSAGEPIPQQLERGWMEAIGVPLMDGFGSTEMLHIYCSNRIDDIHPGSAGKPVTGYQLRIVDEAGSDVPDGTQGHLLIKGPSMAKYYWNKPELSERAFKDGWYDSGDNCYRDAEGYYHFCCRSNDMLKVGGIWVSPLEVEAALLEKEYVLGAAVVGRADDNGMIKPEAWVVLKGGAQGTQELAAQLIAHCKTRLAPYKYPRSVHFVDEFPMTATGKVQRFKLRELGA